MIISAATATRWCCGRSPAAGRCSPPASTSRRSARSSRFVDDTRWKPYIGGGVHYSFVSNVPHRGSQLGAEIAGGVAFNATPRFYVRADAKGLLNHTVYENNVRSLFGLGG
ncbi:MAG TPA: hypothetical protein VG323_06565 [Thermoanaerobaculia bacterium]|nr:hypothetical protein [Thermoanaerobaculia bacterium]